MLVILNRPRTSCEYYLNCTPFGLITITNNTDNDNDDNVIMMIMMIMMMMIMMIMMMMMMTTTTTVMMMIMMMMIYLRVKIFSLQANWEHDENEQRRNKILKIV